MKVWIASSYTSRKQLIELTINIASKALANVWTPRLKSRTFRCRKATSLLLKSEIKIRDGSFRLIPKRSVRDATILQNLSSPVSAKK